MSEFILKGSDTISEYDWKYVEENREEEENRLPGSTTHWNFPLRWNLCPGSHLHEQIWFTADLISHIHSNALITGNPLQVLKTSLFIG